MIITETTSTTTAAATTTATIITTTTTTTTTTTIATTIVITTTTVIATLALRLNSTATSSTYPCDSAGHSRRSTAELLAFPSRPTRSQAEPRHLSA